MSDSIIQQSIEDSMKLAAGKDPAQNDVESAGNIMSWMVQVGQLAPPWWSRARDTALAKAWRESNHLAAAVYNAQAKLVGIEFSVVPKNPSIAKHVDEALILTQVLQVASDFGRGWSVAYSKFLEDLLVRDNGAFLEIIGDGPVTGPIVGGAVAVRHLDSSRCFRTSNPLFPVVYLADDGKRYKFHYTRVIAMSQMPSPILEMNGVGFSPVSRSLEVARVLSDMTIYKQQRLGSRPADQIILGKGITAVQIMKAMKMVYNSLDNRGQTHYAGTVAIGSEDTEIDLKRIPLNHIDPFEEETGTNLGMFLIAIAFGMDIDELWPAQGRGSSKGDSDLKRMRSRGKMPAQVTQELSEQFNFKVLPDHLRLKWDFKDDVEDQAQSLVRDIRGRNRERDLGTGSTNIRVSRANMLRDGDIAQEDFNYMELADGRLPDGSSIAILFFTPDPVFARHLKFDVDPLLIKQNDYDDVTRQIEVNRSAVLAELAVTSSEVKKTKLTRAFHALDWLQDTYDLANGMVIPQVPMQQRRARVDIRVDEEREPQPESSAKPLADNSVDENVPGNPEP